MNANNMAAASSPLPSLPRQTADILLGQQEKDSLYTVGYALYQQAKYTEATPFFTLLSLHEPNNPAYYAALAACQKMTREYEKAIGNYALALLLQPEELEYIVHIAECQIAAQYADGAKETLTQLLALETADSPQTQSLMNKAQALLSLLETKH